MTHYAGDFRCPSIPATIGWLLLFSCLLTSGCQSQSSPAERLNAAVADPQRSEADRVRDLAERPVELMMLLGLREGFAVLDVFAGSGYYSELAAHAVGRRGVVYAHNNAAYMQFAEPQLSERLDRLTPAASEIAPIRRTVAEIGALPLSENSIDAALIMLTYHDVYFRTDNWTVTADALFADLRRVLRPGGRLLIVDHVAAAGRGKADAQELHRIEPSFARADIAARGFSYLAESDLLRRADDNNRVSVFDPSVRGETDKFVMIFSRD